MFNEHYLSLIALRAKSPEAQLALLGLHTDPILHSLSENKNLTPELWDSLFAQSSDYQVRADLLVNAPTKDRTELILKVDPADTNTTLRYLAHGAAHISDELLLKVIAAPFFTPEHAALAMLYARTTPEIAATLWEIIYQACLKNNKLTTIQDAALTAVARYALATEQELLKILDQPRVNYYYTTQLIDHRPGLVSALLQLPLPQRFFNPIAHSRYLTPAQLDQLMQALVRTRRSISKDELKTLQILTLNPWVPTELKLEICDFVLDRQNPADLGHDRELPLHTSQTPTTWHDLAYEISHSYNSGIDPLPTQLPEPLTYEQISYFTSAITLLPEWPWPTLSSQMPDKYRYRTDPDFKDPQYLALAAKDEQTLADLDDLLANTLAPSLDPTGAAGWSIFFSLLPNWDGDLPELLQMALFLAATKNPEAATLSASHLTTPIKL